MSISFEKFVKQDLNLGFGTVDVTMPAGGTAVGDKIGLHTLFGDVYALHDFADLDAALTAIGSDQATLVVSQAAVVASDATVPANVALHFLGAGSFAVNTGITVTVAGGLTAGRYRIFSGSGTVTLSAARLDWVYPEWWGAVPLKATTGTPADSTAAITLALASGKHVSFDSGRYGTTGGHSQATQGQRVQGQGGVYAAGGLGGTELLRLSGTSVLWTAGYAIGMYLGHLRFNGADLGGNCLLWSAHYSRAEHLHFSNQGGTDFALFLKDTNACTWGPLYFWDGCYAAIGDTPATGSYGALYSTFEYVFIATCTAYGMQLIATRLCTFEKVYTEAPIRLTASATHLEFRCLDSEIARTDVPTIYVDSLPNISFNKLRISRTALTTQPEIQVWDTYQFQLTDLFVEDAVSAATRAIVQLVRTDYTNLRNLGCNTTNAHYLVDVITGNAEYLAADGLYSYTGAAASCRWRVTQASIANSNLAQSFVAASSGINFRNIGGAITLTNATRVTIDPTSASVGTSVNFTDADATPSVAMGPSPTVYYVATNTAPTTITTFDDGYVGQRISVTFTTANTTFDFTANATMKGNAGADWTAAVGDRLDAELIGTVWYCTITEGS